MNVFEVFAKLDLDSSGYKNKLENAKKLTVGFGKASTTAFGTGGKSLKEYTASSGGMAQKAKASATALDGMAQKAKASATALGGTAQKAKASATALDAGGKSLKEYTASSDGMAQKAKASFNKLMKAQTTMLQNAKKLAVGFGKASAVAFGAGATAAGALTKKAVDAYSNFEQLKGGVETLFGAGGKSLEEYTASFDGTAQQAKASFNKLMKAQTIMLQNANNAYATAGLSANEYMETVTSFSASLIQSLGGDTQKAAKYADMALVDMSDNANKMGTDMESIQNAYQGFAKQNYSMLDNLKLGRTCRIA